MFLPLVVVLPPMIKSIPLKADISSATPIPKLISSTLKLVKDGNSNSGILQHQNFNKIAEIIDPHF